MGKAIGYQLPEGLDKCRFDPRNDADMRLLADELYKHTIGMRKVDTLLRYVVWMYDEHTPLTKLETNATKRKQAAAKYAGFDIEADDDMLTQIYDLSLPGLIGLINAYMFKYGFSRLWKKIVVNESLFEEYSQRLMAPVGGQAIDAEDGKAILGTNKDQLDELKAYDVKAKLRQELDAIDNSLNNYYAELYKADDTLLEKSKVMAWTPEGQATG